MEHTEAKKAAAADLIPCILELKLTDKSFQKNLIRFFQKICEVDPLTCLKCSSEMRVIALIHDEDVIRKIITSLNIKDFQRKSPHAPPNDGFQIYVEPSLPSIDDYLKEPEYLVESNF